MKLTMLISMLVAAVAAMAPIDVAAQMPPPPPGKVLRPGMMWCDVCGGDGTHGRTWYGWHKTCRKCGGTGMIARPAPPPPQPKVHHHHHAHKPAPAAHHSQKPGAPSAHHGQTPGPSHNTSRPGGQSHGAPNQGRR